MGDFANGWKKHEWRWQNKSLTPRRFMKPLWLGAEPVKGKRLFIYSEQGLGDTIQFCRYAPMVAELGARVILEVPSSLRHLLASLPGGIEIRNQGEPLPQFDLHCPLLSLPLAFDTRLETIPSTTPYLRVPSQTLQKWGQRLGQKQRPTIGLAWSGNPDHKNDDNRSISLQLLRSLFDIEVTFVSLQKDLRMGDATLLKEYAISHFAEGLNTFADTAALISHLDLVISVDTSVAHLAGALAKPVWILLPFVPDWRWLLNRDDSPWYPSATLFRQDSGRAWDGVIKRTAIALSEFARTHV
jgi:hypothetical protein